VHKYPYFHHFTQNFYTLQHTHFKLNFWINIYIFTRHKVRKTYFTYFGITLIQILFAKTTLGFFCNYKIPLFTCTLNFQNLHITHTSVTLINTYFTLTNYMPSITNTRTVTLSPSPTSLGGTCVGRGRIPFNGPTIGESIGPGHRQSRVLRSITWNTVKLQDWVF
jgi:hypothetical protein